MKTAINFGKDNYYLQDEMVLWCRNHLGKGGWGVGLDDTDNLWMVFSAFGNTCFQFRNEADATMFRLRWSDGR